MTQPSSAHLGHHIAAHLRLIRTTWADMLPDSPSIGAGSPTSGTKEPPPPAPIAVLSLRRDVCQLLASWCRLVLDDITDMDGQHMSVRLDGTDAPGMAGWLLTWADWLGDHEAGEVADDEIGSAARKCEAVASRRRTRRFRVGPCIDHAVTDLGERVACTGTLVAVLSSDDDLLPSVLRCDVDPEHAYSAADWRRLGERIHSAGQIPERYTDLARRIAT